MDRKRGLDKHKTMCKGYTPPWKDTYRKRCMDRLKKSRQKLLGQLRKADVNANDEESGHSVVQDLMSEEWNELVKEEKHLPSFDLVSANLELEADDIDWVVSVYEEIRQELLLEEQQILEQYEAGQIYDEKSLCATLENLGSESVICPVCQKSHLMLNKGIVFCRCGMKIDTEQDCITLKMVKHNLEEGLGLHTEMCEHSPQFAAVNQLGVDNLLLTCSVCDYMFIVI